MFEYFSLDEESRNYINKAIDIFASIYNKNLTIKLPPNKVVIDDIMYKDSYELTVKDKVILSLFLAGFLIDGNIKNIFSKYSDVKLQDLLDFYKIKEDEIKKCSNDESDYQKVYTSQFKPILKGMLHIFLYKIDMITPETFYFLIFEQPQTVLDIYSILKLGKEYMCLCQGYNDIRKLVNEKNSLETFGIYLEGKKILAVNSTSEQISKVYASLTKSERDILVEFVRSEKTKRKNKSYTESLDNDKREKGKNNEEEHLWEMLDEIKKKFIGQEDVCEQLFYNILSNQMLAKEENVQDGERAIIFLDGPTGTGKTAITREITEKFGVPFVRTSVTKYSAAGYVGGDLEDILKELYKNSGEDLEKAQRGIVVLDEFEKMTYNYGQGSDLIMKQSVQHQLLDFLGGGKYQISLGPKSLEKPINFDTSRLTFICAGALTNLRRSKTTVKPVLGFDAQAQNSDIESYSITPEDLINMGIERELVGRLNTYLHTEEYSKEDLLKILRTSEISPIKGLINFVSKRNKKLVIDEDAYEEIAIAAYNLNTGARSLQTIVNSLRSRLLKEIFCGHEEVIRIDSNMVREMVKDMTTRKVRG